MNNWWIRFGCFLTGYNYGIVRGSSEMAAKAVKRYTSALLIVCILWSCIGFTFTQRYLHGNLLGALTGSALMVVIIIQIERQIILSVTPSRWLYFSRGAIAAMMAIIGAIIIDQIIFKDDIELEKVTFIEKRVKEALSHKTEELRNQITVMDSTILSKESERLKLVDEVSKNPLINSTSTQTSPLTIKTTSSDSTGKVTTSERIVNSTSVTVTKMANPKQALIAPLDATIAVLRKQKWEKDTTLLSIRPRVEAEITSKIGFLDELKIMYILITGSVVVLIVWCIWFLFLFFLEMLVLFSKMVEKKSDYEKTVEHQMQLQLKKLEVLSRVAEGNGIRA